VADEYPHEVKDKITALIEALETVVKRDPEQEIHATALPVLDAVTEAVRLVRPDDPVVAAARGVISAEQTAEGEPVRAADALVVAKQLDAAIGPPPASFVPLP
jgi:hypothetical protein